MKLTKIWFFSAALALTACGGGGGDSGGTTTTTPPPPATGSPTAKLSNDSNAATALTKIGTNGFNAQSYLSKAPSFSDFQTLLNTTGSCVSGSMNVNVTWNTANQPRAGDSISLQSSNCVFSNGVVIDGNLTITFTRYNSPTDYAETVNMSNFSMTVNGNKYGPVTVSGSVDYVFKNNILSLQVVNYVNGVTVIGTSTVSVVGNIAKVNGKTRVNYDATGWVECQYTDWQVDITTGKPAASNGSISITAANGDTGSITVVNGAYQVVITVNGVTSQPYIINI